MKTIFAAVVLVFVGSPIAGVAIATMRAPVTTIDRAITLIAAGVFLLCASAGVALVVRQIAEYRAAALPRPSHHVAIDRRTQNIDARRVMLVNAAGEQVELPAGAKLVEVMT